MSSFTALLTHTISPKGDKVSALYLNGCEVVRAENSNVFRRKFTYPAGVELARLRHVPKPYPGNDLAHLVDMALQVFKHYPVTTGSQSRLIVFGDQEITAAYLNGQAVNLGVNVGLNYLHPEIPLMLHEALEADRSDAAELAEREFAGHAGRRHRIEESLRRCFEILATQEAAEGIVLKPRDEPYALKTIGAELRKIHTELD